MIHDFEYVAPSGLPDALAALSRHGEEATVIAGGQSLLLLMRQGLIRPRYLVDITGISSLDHILLDGATVRIGALTRHRALETAPLVRRLLPVLVEMEQQLASVQTRNWGSIGGNLCHAHPASDPPPVLIALGATVRLDSAQGHRAMELAEFFKDALETARTPGELLTEIRVPLPSPDTGVAYSKFALLAGDFALASAAVSLNLEPGTSVCRDARIVLGAVGPVPGRAGGAEAVLKGRRVDDGALEEAAQVAAGEVTAMGDMHASEGYRRELVKVLVRRAGHQARERAGGVRGEA